MVSAQCAANRTKKFGKTQPLELVHGFLDNAPHVHLKNHRKSIYQAIATKFSGYFAEMAGVQYAKNRNPKFENTRPLEPDARNARACARAHARNLTAEVNFVNANSQRMCV